MADEQPIIIKKVNKGHGGHHGGAWKVAYADFVTAMMAFFLLLWLLNSVTQEQLEGVSNYFTPTTASKSTSGSDGALGGKVLSEEGALTAQTSKVTAKLDLPPPKVQSKETKADPGESNPKKEALKKQEERQFEEAKEKLEKAMQDNPAFKRLAESLMIDNTPEGLRIQIVDQDGLAMFSSGSSKMFLHTKKILELITKVIATQPQDLAIEGHTDSKKFGGSGQYTNWDLSADRANAARRQLLDLNIPEKRIGRVVGKAAKEPLMKDDPENARNRRLSIILLRGTGDQKLPEEKLPGLRAIQKNQLETQSAKPQARPQLQIGGPKPSK
ncbi:MAG: flagellar motor protein MotB [Rhodospirillaceae bacterium]|jgi:chemotaxis protein MotB